MDNNFNVNKKEIKIKDGTLYYNGFNLVDLATKYGTPLKVTFLDLIKDHILNLKNTFDNVIKENNYQGKFIYLNANKANYGGLEIKEALENSDGLETSSYLDLCLSSDLIKESNNKLLFSNGYKDDKYLEKIVEIANEDLDFTDIIDSLKEYNYLKTRVKNLKIGLRCHMPALYLEENDPIINDRFGLMKNEIEYILDDLKNYPNLTLTTIHFHQRGMYFEKDKFIENIEKSFKNYYVKAKKLYDSVEYFDMGGGTPLPSDKDFNYNEWASLLIKTVKELSLKYQVNEPNIISENGKYSMKDSTIDIYKVVGYKETDRDFDNPTSSKKFYPWYLTDASILIALPEMYALGEDILVMPANNLDDELVEARLSSITCDCDDVYYIKEKGYILLPKYEDGKEQYIALLGVGSYQNSMNGKGGVHHCLLPEEKDLVIYTKDNNVNYLVRSDLQSYEKIKELIKINLKK